MTTRRILLESILPKGKVTINDPYIKVLKTNSLADKCEDGFELGIACDKRTQLTR